jgi:hypothetical protein
VSLYASVGGGRGVFDVEGIFFDGEGDKSISSVLRDLLWQGAAPIDGSDLSLMGGGRAQVFVFMDERAPREWRGCEQVRVFPLQDNLQDPPTKPPTVRGMTFGEIVEVSRAIARRIYHKEPTIVLSRFGYSRSALITWCALRLIGASPQEAMRLLHIARGTAALSGANRNFAEFLNAEIVGC